MMSILPLFFVPAELVHKGTIVRWHVRELATCGLEHLYVPI